MKGHTLHIGTTSFGTYQTNACSKDFHFQVSRQNHSGLIDDQWNSVLDCAHTLSVHTKRAFIQLKVVYRVHLTNATLENNLEPCCARCRSQPAVLMCDLITDVLAAPEDHHIRNLHKLHILWDPIRPWTRCSLWFNLKEILLPKKTLFVIAFTTLLSNFLILSKWAWHAPPSFSHWVGEVMYFLKVK